MPRSIASKMAFYDNVLRLLEKAGSQGLVTSALVRHFQPSVAEHVVRHALMQMKKEGRVTRWRHGREDAWVNVAAQQRTNAEAKGEVQDTFIPNLKIGVVKSTGALRLDWQGLRIEIGLIE